MTQVRIREADKADVSFIFNSWLKSNRNSLFSIPITNTVYFSEHHKIIEKLLKTQKTVIACNAADPDQIYGFANGGRVDGIFVLHYVYVKQSFRSLGIAKELLNAFKHDFNTAAMCTHLTKQVNKLAEQYNLIYSPYILINDYLPKVEEIKIDITPAETAEKLLENLEEGFSSKRKI